MIEWGGSGAQQDAFCARPSGGVSSLQTIFQERFNLFTLVFAKSRHARTHA